LQEGHLQYFDLVNGARSAAAFPERDFKRIIISFYLNIGLLQPRSSQCNTRVALEANLRFLKTGLKGRNNNSSSLT